MEEGECLFELVDYCHRSLTGLISDGEREGGEGEGEGEREREGEGEGEREGEREGESSDDDTKQPKADFIKVRTCAYNIMCRCIYMCTG